MKNHIEPEYGNFHRLTANRLFVIPDYQRHYSWHSSHRKDLFNDILEVALKKQDMHFMATIVCLNTGEKVDIGTTRYSKLSVIDGQQRITTLVALLKAIEIGLSQGRAEEQAEEVASLRNWIAPDGGNFIILHTNHDGSGMFANYLRTGTVPQPSQHFATRADRNLYDLILDVTEFVSKWETLADGQPLLRLLSIVKNDVTFLLQELSEERTVYKIFEVLNSRGLSVDVLDKLKAMLMGIGYDLVGGTNGDGLQPQLRNIWTQVYREVGTANVPGHELVRLSATLHDPAITSRPLSSDDALKHFDVWCRSGEDTGTNKGRLIEASEWVRDAASALKDLYKDGARRSVTRITHARMLAVAIALRSKNDPAVPKDRWMKQWEKATFRLFGMFAKDSRTAVGKYNRLAQNVWHGNIADEDVPQAIMGIVADEGDKYSIEKAIEELRNRDCYTDWQVSLRYMLYRIEQELARRAGHSIDNKLWNEIWQDRADDTIEHILPEDPSWWDKPEWKGAFSVRKNEKRLAMVNCLGNLTLLPKSQNSKAGGRPFYEKKNIYAHNNLLIHGYVLEQEEWTQKHIIEREQALLDIARDIWGGA